MSVDRGRGAAGRVGTPLSRLMQSWEWLRETSRLGQAAKEAQQAKISRPRLYSLLRLGLAEGEIRSLLRRVELLEGRQRLIAGGGPETAKSTTPTCGTGDVGRSSGSPYRDPPCPECGRKTAMTGKQRQAKFRALKEASDV